MSGKRLPLLSLRSRGLTNVNGIYFHERSCYSSSIACVVQESSQAILMENINCLELIGMKSAFARKWITDHGMSPRTVKEDGKLHIVTRDYNTKRVNLSIKDDVVVWANIG